MTEKKKIFILLPLVLLFTRIPFLFPGYGLDADAWRVAKSVKHISETREYVASRLPGYPVHEYLLSLTIFKQNYFTSNLLTAIFSVLAMFLFTLILKEFKVKNYLLIGTSILFVPVIYVNSVNTMDYMIALAFMLGAFYSLIKKKTLFSGIFLGLAIGSRITSGAFLIPLLYWIYTSDYQKKKVTLILLSSTLLTAILCYMPVFFKYGSGFFSFYDNVGYPSFALLVGKGVLQVWGTIGILSILGLLAYVLVDNVKFVTSIFSDDYKKRIVIFSLSVIFLYTVAFLRLPHEAAYLIPIVPFVLILLAISLPSKLISLFIPLLIISSFVANVDTKGFSVLGPILSQHLKRNVQMREGNLILENVKIKNKKTLLVSGVKCPQLMLMKDNENLKLVYLIENEKELSAYLNEGYSIYFLKGVDKYNFEYNQIDLVTSGAIELE